MPALGGIFLLRMEIRLLPYGIHKKTEHEWETSESKNSSRNNSNLTKRRKIMMLRVHPSSNLGEIVKQKIKIQKNSSDGSTKRESKIPSSAKSNKDVVSQTSTFISRLLGKRKKKNHSHNELINQVVDVG